MKLLKRKNKSAVSKVSERVCIISDLHFDLHDKPTWNAFIKWFKDVKPDKLVVLGDFVDLGMLSRFSQGANDPIYAIEQIKAFIKEINPLSKCSEVILVEGNHDDRWDRIMKGPMPTAFRDAIGLKLKDQFYAQGLSKDIKWITEDTKVRGLQCGPYLLRHGHNQSGRYGGGKHLAANKLDKGAHENEVFGHHHRAQMYCKTAGGKTAVAIANPCMTIDHDYSMDPNWQRGFTMLELFGANNKFATPYLILIENGKFAYNGKVYDGNS